MKYELTIITPGDQESVAAGAKVTAVKKMLEETGAKVSFDKTWGRRDLAYPIAKQMQGYYTTFEFEAPGEQVTAIERALRLDKQVIRFLTVQAYEHPTPLVEPRVAAPTGATEARSAEESLRRGSGEAKAKPAKKSAAKKPAKKIAEGELETKVDEALSKILEDK